MRILAVALSALSLLFVHIPAANGDIVIDYSQDGGFFTANPKAMDALDAAVADINDVLILNLGAITNDTTMGSSGGGTADFNFKYNYTNPSSGASETISDTTLAANEIIIFAGARILGGTTLGQGGPGSFGFTAGYSGPAGSAQAAVDQAMLNDQHRRGDGPVMGNLSGNFAPTLPDVTYSFDVGPTIGNLWFDSDTDNMNGADDTPTLNSNWHFDHTTPVAAGKSDFYSVALHEVLHAIGFGSSDTWLSLVDGGEWLGPNAIAEHGNVDGTGLVDTDSGGAHIENGIMSTTILDGMPQEVAMDPDITVGTRKYLTRLDVAFLSDLGYSTTLASVPEPSAFLFGGLVCVVLGGKYVRKRRLASVGSALISDR